MCVVFSMVVAILILIFIYNIVPSKEDTEASDSNEDVGEPEEPDPEPAVSSTAFALPRGPSGRSTYLKLTS